MGNSYQKQATAARKRCAGAPSGLFRVTGSKAVHYLSASSVPAACSIRCLGARTPRTHTCFMLRGCFGSSLHDEPVQQLVQRYPTRSRARHCRPRRDNHNSDKSCALESTDCTGVTSKLRLTERETHVWSVLVSEELLAQLPAVLDENDEERARRLVFPEHRVHFRCVRTVLRLLLATYLATEPDHVRLVYGPHGKPGVDGLRFNISHSGELAVLAFTLLPAVGIDVEELREIPSAITIARHYFSGAEQRALATLPERGSASFLRCWTRKEAFVKALGPGLAIDLTSFDVSLDADRAQLLDLRDASSSAADWQLHNLSLPQGFVGSLTLSRSEATHEVIELTFPRVLFRSRTGSHADAVQHIASRLENAQQAFRFNDGAHP